MADDTNTTSGQQPAKDPLAVLEELLAKQKQGGAAAGASAPSEADEEAAKRQAEFERIQAEATERDAALLQQQEVKLEEIKQSPEYQSRVRQNQAAADQKQQESEAQAGYTISQLTTTRVPVQTTN